MGSQRHLSAPGPGQGGPAAADSGSDRYRGQEQRAHRHENFSAMVFEIRWFGNEAYEQTNEWSFETDASLQTAG